MVSSSGAARSHVRPGWGWAVGAGVLAFAVRLDAVLRGGGLFGRIGYDGAVYYASASGLWHGVLPYRDFLLLHPPGIVLALLPFAALGGLVGDPVAFALARLAWFAIGAVSTVLVFVAVRPRGLRPAVVAAVFYAVFVPAVTTEHTTSLEAVGSLCLLAAVVLLTLPGDRATRSAAPLLVAGALLGLASATKIWGVTIVLVLVAVTATRLGVRRGALLLGAAVGGATLVCLPFFLAAPGPMWRMVVLDQMGRRREPEGVASRLVDLLGFSQLRESAGITTLAVVAVSLLLVVLVLAVRDPLGRLAALLLVVTGGVLLASPSWSVPYTGLSAPALALLVGCAAARLDARAGWRRPLSLFLAGATLVAYAVVSLPSLTFGTAFPGPRLGRVLAKAGGCVATDDPIALIETGALQRNFDRGCPLVVDLSGYSYDLRPGAELRVMRIYNGQWQQFALDHLGSGTTAVVVRFRKTPGLSQHTKDEIARWPVVADVKGYRVHRPPPRTAVPR